MNHIDFFYDEQIRRFLLQFIRMLSGFQVKFGNDALQTVPVFYGDQSRQAAQLLRGVSENATATVPAMAVYISSLNFDQSRLQDPFLVTKVHLRERMVDPATGMLTGQQGDGYTVERPMPMPYMLGLKMDIWTSNTEQKLQLVEQMATLFTPSLEIQSTDNYVDWTSLSAVFLKELIWDSRTVPMGAEDSISIATMSFDLPIWISPPARVTKMGVVKNFVNNMVQLGRGVDPLDAIAQNDDLMRKATTLMNYGVEFRANTLRLFHNRDAVLVDPETNELTVIRGAGDYDWKTVISQYGEIRAGLSEVRLLTGVGHEIVGTVAYHPFDPGLLLFEVFPDTLTANSLKPVEAIIDPYKMAKDHYRNPSNTESFLLNHDGTYKIPAGTRYLITASIDTEAGHATATAWSPNGHSLRAHAGDIIEYDGTQWRISFDSQRHSDKQYMTNLTTGIQYVWNGEAWEMAHEGIYRGGEWTLVL